MSLKYLVKLSPEDPKGEIYTESDAVLMVNKATQNRLFGGHKITKQHIEFSDGSRIELSIVRDAHDVIPG